MRPKIPALDKIMLTPMRIKPSKNCRYRAISHCLPIVHSTCFATMPATPWSGGNELAIKRFKSDTYGLSTAATFELRSGVNPTQ